MYIEEFSKIGLVGSTLVLPINWESLETLITLKYYDADPLVGSANLVVPTAGTAVITAKLVIHEKYVALVDGSFDATLASRASVLGNITELKVVPTGITGATHYEILAVSHGEEI